ncbi:MAG: sugar ABC transporter substrate-binding protein [Candidatus Atribacteria bacterium]|nr:sugar ABC transporter substrate-binding protein [Candidatus Atribacteria bacterium]
MRKVSFVLIIMSLVIGLIAINGFAANLKIGYIASNMAADSNVAAYAGMVDYAEREGWEVELIDCQGDLTKFSPNIINFVSKGVDAIALCCSEKSLIEEGVVAATKAGIPVFLEDTENIGETIVNGTSNCWAMGALLGSQVVDRIRAMHGTEGGNVAIIGMPDLYVHRQRHQMMEAVFNSPENPDINILAVEACDVSNWPNLPYEITRAWITQYGDELDAIIGTWDGIGWGVSRAVLDSGMTKDNIFTMSIDGSEQTYDLIRKGDPFVGVIAQNFYGWSEVVGDAIKAIVVEGKDPASVIPVSKTVYVPYKWIDSTNVPAEGEGVEFGYEGLF